MTTVRFDASRQEFHAGSVLLSEIAPLIDGEVASSDQPGVEVLSESQWALAWPMPSGETFRVEITSADERLSIRAALTALQGERRLMSLGLRFGRVGNAVRYLRNGYMSWDGSYFVEPENARVAAAGDPSILSGYAMTALVGRQGGAAVLGFDRHDRYQSRFRFDFIDGPLSLDVETLIDLVPFAGTVQAEQLVLLHHPEVEEGLRQWARTLTEAAPVAPRLPPRRQIGWCSWYNLYATLSPELIDEHLQAARRFRDQSKTPLDVFQIDDGFTPEMGDWLETRPQFPNGMKSVLDGVSDAGFTPGLWIAPFMVGNRSKLYADHPDWVVKDRMTGKPLAPMTFYGEFRWHKRSEEYYVLDVTHPDAEAYIRNVFRVWAKEWGCGYFKADFMHIGSIYGPERARWHLDGLSRIEIWMRMARLIREEIGEAIWLACGAPVWAPVGYADAMRFGRDIGVSWKGHYSAESLLRDQTSRNFANGILWQGDPDCILLRDRFHNLSDEQVRSLALFAGLAGGVLMTSDNFDEIPADRRALFHDLAGDAMPYACDFPLLGTATLTHGLITGPTGNPMMTTSADPVIVQRVLHADKRMLLNVFNTSDVAVERFIAFELAGAGSAELTDHPEHAIVTDNGIYLRLGPHQSVMLTFRTEA